MSAVTSTGASAENTFSIMEEVFFLLKSKVNINNRGCFL